MSQSKGSNNAASPAGPHAIVSPSVDQLKYDMADINLDSAQESEWEVIAEKSKNRALANAKPWGSSTINPSAWGHSEGGFPAKGWGSNNGSKRNPGNNSGPPVDSCKPAGSGNSKPQQPNRGWEAAYTAPPCVIAPPLQHGWQWENRGGSTGTLKTQETSANVRSVVDSLSAYDSEPGIVHEEPDDVSDEEDDDLLDDSDDDLSDDCDSDASEKSHETRKMNRWLTKLFDVLDSLKEEEIIDPNRQWHCPACHDGPGAIDWYRGLQPLMTHARTRGTRRVRLHRELAVLLEEELRRRGSSVVPAGEVFGKWKGLCETTADHEIIWPPTVVIMNTLLEKDDRDKWTGMGNPELVDYFSNYAAARARHSYGPNGHRGMSVLIFNNTAMGYLEAERLHKQFEKEGRDRDGWERRRILFYPGGKRQLYGFLATNEDMEIFNQHSAGKSCLKYDVKSYQKMVVTPMRKMSEDNQKLNWYKQKAVNQEQRSKAFEESFEAVSQTLRETLEENRIVRLRTMMQHEENKEEMDYQESFLMEQMEKIHKATEEKEMKFERLLQAERAKAKQSDMDSGINEDRKHRKEETESFICGQEKGIEEFEAKREKLIRTHEQKKVEFKRKHLQEEVELEKEFHTALNQLMEEYTPGAFRRFNDA